jgi:phosphatidate cytidylyltransferase
VIQAPDPALFWPLAAVFTTLVVGSIVRLITLRNAGETERRQRLASLRTWWMLASFISAAMLVGRLGICLLLSTASCIAWFEITRMFRVRAVDRLAVRAGYGLIIINYLLILFGSASLFVIFLPLGACFVFAILLLLAGEPQGYIRSAGGLLWGMMFLGYGLSHAAFVLMLPAAASGPLGAAGWLLFLIILTETDDIFQAIIGRAFGSHKRHRITAVISPNKTWEGFIGGMLVTITLSLLIAPWLTTLDRHAGPFELGESLQPWLAPILAAILIAIASFFGDINMSAIKRDAGVKDSSGLLPGMGGIIDRVDSLTLSAPVFVYFLSWWLA